MYKIIKISDFTNHKHPTSMFAQTREVLKEVDTMHEAKLFLEGAKLYFNAPYRKIIIEKENK